MKRLILMLILITSGIFANNLKEEDLNNAIKKCEARDKYACRDVGIYYSNMHLRLGEKDDNLKELAILYYTKGCDLKEGDSCSGLGSHYAEVDSVKSFEFRKKGCDYNSPFGCYFTASKYEKDADKASGKEKKELTRQSKRYYKKACDLGDKQSCYYK